MTVVPAPMSAVAAHPLRSEITSATFRGAHIVVDEGAHVSTSSEMGHASQWRRKIHPRASVRSDNDAEQEAIPACAVMCLMCTVFLLMAQRKLEKRHSNTVSQKH
mgnify:CR=1 FL=1